MAKESISITIDGRLKEMLGVYAKNENRTISNLLEVILSEYIQKKDEELELKQSFLRARSFASKLVIKDYITTEKELDKNVFLSQDDKKFLNRK